MTKLFVLMKNTDVGSVIDADEIRKDDMFLCAYLNGKLVGVYDLNMVATAYLSTMKK